MVCTTGPRSENSLASLAYSLGCTSASKDCSSSRRARIWLSRSSNAAFMSGAEPIRQRVQGELLLRAAVQIAQLHHAAGELVAAQGHRPSGADAVGPLHPLARLALEGEVDGHPGAPQVVGQDQGPRFGLGADRHDR